MNRVLAELLAQLACSFSAERKQHDARRRFVQAVDGVDFLVKLSDKKTVIVETKGLEDLDVPLKMERLRQWCEDINRVQSEVQYDFVYVDEKGFKKYNPTTFQKLTDGFRKYKE